jgi:hypothetical protein
MNNPGSGYTDTFSFWGLGSIYIVNEMIPALQKIKESRKARTARFIRITRLPLGIYTFVFDWVPPGSVDVILSYCHFGINETMTPPW